MDHPRIYLDHAATTPLHPAARAAMLEGFARWANPSSPHAEGRAARAALEDARERIKIALGWQGEMIFTSGASEALALALARTKRERRLISPVEHDALFRVAANAEVLPLADGEIDGDALERALVAPGSALVALQAINSETGTTLLPMIENAVVDRVRSAGGLVLADCAQLAGKRPLPDCDMAVVAAHKFGGPIGIGALLVRDFAMLDPGGGQERGYRGGTENLPGVLGMAAALEVADIETWPTTAVQRYDFKNALFRTGQVIAPGNQCSHIFAVASPKFSARALLIQLDARGFAVSAGSACSSGSLKPSRVLAAFGVAPEVAERTIRVSIGWTTTPEDLDAFAEVWADLHR